MFYGTADMGWATSPTDPCPLLPEAQVGPPLYNFFFPYLFDSPFLLGNTRLKYYTSANILTW